MSHCYPSTLLQYLHHSQISQTMGSFASVSRLSDSVSSPQDVVILRLGENITTSSSGEPPEAVETSKTVKLTFIAGLNPDSPVAADVLVRFIRFLTYGFYSKCLIYPIVFYNSFYTLKYLIAYSFNSRFYIRFQYDFKQDFSPTVYI